MDYSLFILMKGCLFTSLACFSTAQFLGKIGKLLCLSIILLYICNWLTLCFCFWSLAWAIFMNSHSSTYLNTYRFFFYFLLDFTGISLFFHFICFVLCIKKPFQHKKKQQQNKNMTLKIHELKGEYYCNNYLTDQIALCCSIAILLYKLCQQQKLIRERLLNNTAQFQHSMVVNNYNIINNNYY